MLLPTPDDVIAAEARIRPHIAETPLWHAPALSEWSGTNIWIKGEALGPLASFKLRGALNHLLHEPGVKRAVTSSTGNHGQAVAFAARLLDQTADIFLPESAPETKRQAIARLGGILHIGGADLDAAKQTARSFAQDHQAAFVDDGESPHIITGAGTIGLEIARQLPEADYVFTPVGAGCLASGTALGLKAAGAKAQVIGVTSAQTPCMALSFHAGHAISHPVSTLCDCLDQRIPPELSLATLMANVADMRMVEDSACLSAMKLALTHGHMLIEPGTAAVLAGLHQMRQALAGKNQALAGKNIVLVFSGANVDQALMARALASPDLGS